MEDQRAEEIWYENEWRSGCYPSKYRERPLNIPTPAYLLLSCPSSFVGCGGDSGGDSGYSHRSDCKTDCYFYYEEYDMNAIVPCCTYVKTYGYCPCKDCKEYISKSDVLYL